MSSRSDADRPGAGAPLRPEMDIASNKALPPRRHLRGLVIWLAAVLALVLVAMLVSFGLGDRLRSQTNSTDAFAATARSLVQSEEAAPRSPATKTIASVLPSVVNVRVVKVGASASGQVGEARAEGSGVVIAQNGVIVTNDHVVQGAVQVRVVFTDGHPTMPGTVVGTDPQHDIAVVKVDASGLNPATLGDRASSRSRTPSTRSDSPSTSV
jgi:S1-C subfamily serine protease